MIIEFEFRGIMYEAEVDDFELSNLYLKGSDVPLPYSHDLFLEAENLIMNDMVSAAEALYDQEMDR